MLVSVVSVVWVDVVWVEVDSVSVGLGVVVESVVLEVESVIVELIVVELVFVPVACVVDRELWKPKDLSSTATAETFGGGVKHKRCTNAPAIIEEASFVSLRTNSVVIG